MKLAERMSRLGTETAFEVLAKARRLESEGRDIIHLEIGEPDFDTPAHVVQAGIEALGDGHTHYGPSPGLIEVRERIAEEVSRTRNISVTADNVVVTPGGKPIMFFAILALVDEGDEVLYPNPGFPIYESMIRFVGGVPVPMKLPESRDFNVDVDEVASQITPMTKLMIINSPNNPCGSIVEKRQQQELADLAKEHDIVVLSDEIYIRFLYEGEHHSVASFPRDARADHNPGRLLQELCDDGLAHRLRCDASGARGAYISAVHQQRIVHGQLYAEGGPGGDERPPGRLI